MGLATVGIQTASGSSGPEMAIEGVLQAEQLRDYLYTEMRGSKAEVNLASGSGNDGVLDANVLRLWR